MIDLFGVPWERLDRSHVEQFLDSAEDEGINWEAKGAGKDESHRPRRETLRKAACGFANQIGGYLIVGASKKDSKWVLDGIPRPSPEPRLWLRQVLGELRPKPLVDVSKLFELSNGRIAMVARIEQVANTPCMTAEGRIYERVSGATVEVTDPVVLDKLFRRGEHARLRAEKFAGRAAEQAIKLPDWISQRSVSICVGLASIGRETDDISSRLFTPRVHELIVDRIWKLHGDSQPEPADIRPTQDSYLARFDSPSHRTTDGGKVVGVTRMSHFIKANWDGSAAAGLWSADELQSDVIEPESVIERCWQPASEIIKLLGGHGPAYLQRQGARREKRQDRADRGWCSSYRGSSSPQRHHLLSASIFDGDGPVT